MAGPAIAEVENGAWLIKPRLRPDGGTLASRP